MRRLAIMLTGFAVTVLLSGCAGGSAVTMPDVVGKRLDIAVSDVKRAGFDKDVEVLGGGLFGVIDKSNWTVCSQEPSKGAKVSSAPRLTVDRTCDTDSTPDPTSTVASSESPSEEATEPAADTYSYKGPQYEIVTVDHNQSSAKLSQYWVYTKAFDYSTDAYKDQVKMIVADIAHAEGTNKLFAEIVTDKEIAQAESPSTYESFINEHGGDYAVNTIPKHEVTGWIASYTGGFDFGTGEPSGSVEAFGIDWFPYGPSQHDIWKPEAVD